MRPANVQLLQEEATEGGHSDRDGIRNYEFPIQSRQQRPPAISAADDRVALGYVFGFHDALCQAMKIPGSSHEGFAVLLTSFDLLAGPAGERILEQCVALQSDPEFQKGMKIGGGEAYRFLRDHKPVLGLSTHLQQRAT